MFNEAIAKPAAATDAEICYPKRRGYFSIATV